MISSSSAILPCSISRSFFSNCKKQKPFHSLPFKEPRIPILCLRIGVQEIAELAQNKPFLAVAISTAIGQLSKPFTSALYGNGINLRAIFQSGGMPSTHSAGVVAVATSLGFERGLSDSVFGMSVVYAAIVMYDAQGVRREAGYHAKVLNQMFLESQEKLTPSLEEDALINSKQETFSTSSESLPSFLSLPKTQTSYMPNSVPPFGRRDIVRRTSSLPSHLALAGKEVLGKDGSSCGIPLKEYVGHTELEVLAGALLGFVVSIAVEKLL